MNTLLAQTAIPIAVIHAWTELVPGHASELPPAPDGWGFQIGGFDCYTDAPRGQTQEEYLWMLERVAAIYPRLLLVPDGQMFPHDTEAGKLARVNALAELAVNDARIIAVCPYLWGSYQADGYLYRGTRDVPFLRERYRQIGRQLTGAASD